MVSIRIYCISNVSLYCFLPVRDNCVYAPASTSPSLIFFSPYCSLLALFKPTRVFLSSIFSSDSLFHLPARAKIIVSAIIRESDARLHSPFKVEILMLDNDEIICYISIC